MRTKARDYILLNFYLVTLKNKEGYYYIHAENILNTIQ